MLDPFFCINLVSMLVIMHNTLCISHYASFGKPSKLSNFWVASDSLWVEPLVTASTPPPTATEHCREELFSVTAGWHDQRCGGLCSPAPPHVWFSCLSPSPPFTGRTLTGVPRERSSSSARILSTTRQVPAFLYLLRLLLLSDQSSCSVTFIFCSWLLPSRLPSTHQSLSSP